MRIGLGAAPGGSTRAARRVHREGTFENVAGRVYFSDNEKEVPMRIKLILASIAVLCVTAWAVADLTPWKDYEVSDAVWQVTTVKVDSNMGDAYLEGIRGTWAAAMDVSKELGQVEDYKILRSDLPDSGHFNLLLMVKYKNTEMLGPSKERYDAFLEKWGQEKLDETTEYAQKNYPAMRELTGQYLLREITLK